jgi:DNA-binding FadR family transcriptional regulator
MQSINMALKREQASILHNSTNIRPRSLNFHGKLLDAIKTGDSKAARKIMLDHVLDIEEEMYAIFREQHPEA